MPCASAIGIAAPRRLTKPVLGRDRIQGMTRRFASLLLLFMLLAGAEPAHAGGQVNILGWPDYIDTQVLEDFTRETGIKVVYDTFVGSSA